MKFLCDRCKTRYSIGDDRVRGKILKIRCKNCNNVITVREGMPEAPAQATDDQGRKKQQTIGLEMNPSATGNGALGKAFASAMTKPPPALEEEWYVSIEGDQAGPFNLAEAQRWVANKPYDAELHCWSEGFDDWLPVDKVSHFRGLRKKPVVPAPSAPPPIPRAATGAHRAVTRPAHQLEDEPKPLFAATMASLEKATQPPLGSGNFQIPAISPPTATPAVAPSTLRGTPIGGNAAMPMQARTNGNAALKPAPLPVSPARMAASAVAPKFDPSDSVTAIDTPPFDDEKATKAEPVASAAKNPFVRPDPFAHAKADPFAQTTPQPARAKPDPFGNAFGKQAPAPLDTTQPIQPQDIDDDLNIGEVSRVVKLADIVKPPPRGDRAQPVSASQSGRASQLAMNKTGSLGSIPILNKTGSLGSIPLPTLDDEGRQIDPNTGTPVPLAPQVAVSHRRGMIALMVGALLLLGAAGVVVFMVLDSDDTGGGGLGGVSDIDTTRPDDPRRGSGIASKDPDPNPPNTNPFVPKARPRTNPNTNVTPPPNPDAKSLRPDEVEEMASKNSATTNRCYQRSQRGAEGIIIGDLKRLGVTLVVDAKGTVTSVTLSEHSTTGLGKCLIGTIRGWKFRESTAGITARITMVFQGA